MTRTYRVDFEHSKTLNTVVKHFVGLANARDLARKMSYEHGAAYIIASDDGKDTGQIYYSEGRAVDRDFVEA